MKVVGGVSPSYPIFVATKKFISTSTGGRTCISSSTDSGTILRSLIIVYTLSFSFYSSVCFLNYVRTLAFSRLVMFVFTLKWKWEFSQESRSMDFLRFSVSELTFYKQEIS